MTIGVKRFTNEANRGFAFSLFYSVGARPAARAALHAIESASSAPGAGA